ncbi:esterase/lipase [Spongiibacter sp. IMCC21906]|nr:esterase/lipase [Spongiibacter sp. IMCC21906]
MRMIFALACVLLLLSLSSVVSLKYRQLKVWSALYWLLAVTGQLFALPILIIALSLFLTGRDQPGVAIVSAVTALAASLSLLKQLQVRKAVATFAEDLGIATRRDFYYSWQKIWRSVLVLHCNRRGMQLDKNISYGDLAEQRLDIYRLDTSKSAMSTSELMPILIHIHGGAWVAGKKGQMGRPLIHDMATEGWLVVDIEYRLGPEHRYPAMIEDVLKAIAWVKTHAEEYGGSANFIALTGGSAGGHLSALAGLLDCGERRGLQQGFEEVDTRVQAIVPFYGRYDFLDRFNIINDPKIKQFMIDKVMPVGPIDAGEQLWRQASPIDHVAGHFPPCLLIHGSSDCMIDVAEANAFVDAQRPLSTAPFYFVTVPGAQHAFDLGYCLQAEAVNTLTQYFLKDCYRQFVSSTSFEKS